MGQEKKWSAPGRGIKPLGPAEVMIALTGDDRFRNNPFCKLRGTQRAHIKRGLRVAIVWKADQESGALTEGMVRDILTSSPTHPRGIKVRLESGQVGRVKRILA